MLGALRPYGSLAPYGTMGAGVVVPPLPPAATVRQAVRRLLLTDATIAALVGDRIHPGALPQDCPLPAISYAVAGTREPRTLARATPYRATRFRVSIWSDFEAEAEDVAEAARAALAGFSGLVGAIRVALVAIEGEVDLPEPRPDGGDESTYRITLDLRAWHRSA